MINGARWPTLLADSEDFLVEKIKMWKTGMEEKGLRVNMGKTKVMRCRDGAGKVVKSGKYPCWVCSKWVGTNSIECTSYHAWIHKKCSDITGKQKHVKDYRCRRCVGGNPVRSVVLSVLGFFTNRSVPVPLKFWNFRSVLFPFRFFTPTIIPFRSSSVIYSMLPFRSCSVLSAGTENLFCSRYYSVLNPFRSR